MPWLIDASNVLGAMRQSDDAKRGLLRLCAGFARAKRTKVTCIFDGPEPPSFARHLGGVLAVFSGSRSADELIAERAAHGRGWSVVTGDRGLAARVQRRQVTVVTPGAFLRESELAASTDETAGDDWSAWFSDPKNKLNF